jgi:hypothetical protein
MTNVVAPRRETVQDSKTINCNAIQETAVMVTSSTKARNNNIFFELESTMLSKVFFLKKTRTTIIRICHPFCGSLVKKSFVRIWSRSSQSSDRSPIRVSITYPEGNLYKGDL